MTELSDVTLLVAACLLLLLWVVWVFANRLDRLHRKVATTRAVLETQLVRRASAAAELASSGLLDPVSSVLVGEAAWAALAAGGRARPDLASAVPDLVQVLGPDVTRADDVDRDLAESELSRTVREALADDEEVAELEASPGGAELVGALAAAWYRVQLARRFHNEAVAQAQRVRRKVLVRALRLAGRAPMPQTVEIDDDWPEALRRVAQAA